MSDKKINIQFEKAAEKHKELIFNWLEEPHMIEFWDNTQEHKDDIMNFIHGRKQHYFYGTTQYWIGLIDDEPFCFLLSDRLEAAQELPDLYKTYLSKTGHTMAIDFGIGNKNRLGQGLASPTLEAFVIFYHKHIDPKADTFFIDPDENNPRAKHVYQKAGFKEVGEYGVQTGAFVGQTSYLMVKTI
jgi:RimJ/RimL family protein N-acetyltransferase